MSEKNCGNCEGMCCKYVAIQIDTPEELEDFENIRWYVAHENISVFIDEKNEWYVEFITPCEFLGKNNLCGIYEKRPKICRNYKQDVCLFHNENYSEKYSFKKLEDVEDYIENVFKKGKHIIPEGD